MGTLNSGYSCGLERIDLNPLALYKQSLMAGSTAPLFNKTTASLIALSWAAVVGLQDCMRLREAR